MAMPNANNPDHGNINENTENPEDTSVPSTSHFTIEIHYATIGGDLNRPENGNGNTNANGGEPSGTVMTPVILRFADVPNDTSSSRLNQVIALASEYIFQTLARNNQRHRGINKESFEKLELRDVETIEDKTCAICYDDLVNETKIGVKRSRETEASSDNNKRHHSGDPGTNDGAANAPTSTEQSGNNIRNAEEHTVSENENGSLVPTEEEGEGTEDQTPTYQHSPTMLPCGHIFGRECLYRWTGEHNSCPICRAAILSDEELREIYQRDDEANDNNETRNNIQQSTFESIRQMLYQRPTDTTTSNISNGSNAEQVPAVANPPENPNPAGQPPTPVTGQNTNQTAGNAEGNNQIPFSSSFLIFTPNLRFMSRPLAATEESAESNDSQTQVRNGSIPVEPTSPNTETNDVNTTRSGPSINHLNDLPEEVQGVLRSIREAMPRIHSQRAENQTAMSTNTANTNRRGDGGQDGTHDNRRGQTARRLLNILPLFGPRSQVQTQQQRNNSSDETHSSNDVADRALENRYRAYLDHFSTLRNGNRPSSDSSSARFRLPSFFSLGRGTRNHQHSGGEQSSSSSTTSSEPQPSSNLFSSGVASYRHANGVRTVNFNGEIPEPPASQSDLGSPPEQEHVSVSQSEQNNASASQNRAEESQSQEEQPRS